MLVYLRLYMESSIVMSVETKAQADLKVEIPMPWGDQSLGGQSLQREQSSDGPKPMRDQSPGGPKALERPKPRRDQSPEETKVPWN